MIANLTAGSAWSGSVDRTTPFPSSFRIDYIRVYQDLGTTPPPPPPGPAPINGTAANDTLRGGPGNDTINGLGGGDRLYGYAGDDTINGGVGHDYIYSGPGADVLTGGSNNDNFVFDAPLMSGIDRITDFSTVYDRMRLENAVFTTLPGGQLSSTSFYKAQPRTMLPTA